MRTPLGFFQYQPTATQALDLTNQQVGQAPGTYGTGGAFVIPSNAIYVLMSVEVQSIRFRDDGGGSPTASSGILLGVTQWHPFEYWGPLNPAGAGKPYFQFIAAVAGGILNVAYYR